MNDSHQAAVDSARQFVREAKLPEGFDRELLTQMNDKMLGEPMPFVKQQKKIEADASASE